MHKNTNSIFYLSENDIEKQSITDLLSFQKKTGKPISFPIFPEEVAEVVWGIITEYPLDIVDNEGKGALACYIPAEKKIQLNSSMDTNKGRTSFSLAHEVGHVSLHSFLVDFSPEGVKSFFRSIKQDDLIVKIEKQADTYASCLLMPREEVLKIVRKFTSLGSDNIFEFGLNGKKVCDYFRVSGEALCIRLNNLGITVINSPYTFYKPKKNYQYTSDEERQNWY